MKIKKSITLFSTLVLPALGFSQITIDQSSYANWQANEDSIHYFSDTAVIPNLNTGADQKWDLSTLGYAASGIISNNSGTNNDFPDATYYSVINYSFTDGLNYNTELWGAVTTDGVEYMGESMNRQAFGLGNIPLLSSTDSLIFPQQTIVYSSNEALLSFPASYNSDWSTDYNFSMDFIITIGLAGYDNDTGQRKTYVQTVNEVSGWGSMTVKNPHTGNVSDTIDVLQVQQTVMYTDSFYIDGSPVPSTILGQMGMQQGMEYSLSTVNYYRMGEVTPLVTLYYEDDTYTDASSGFVHTENVGNSVSLTETEKISSVNIYPNPVVDHTLNIQANEALKGSVNYAVLDINGKMVDQGEINLQDIQSIELNPSLPSGTYFLSIGENGKAPFVKSFLLK